MTTTTRRQFTLERTYQASIDDVWDLWTTKAGIESWWGPEGFTVTVKTLDLEPGGELVYLMEATGPQQRQFMEQAGMPVVTEAKLTYREIASPRRLTYATRADFIPGVEPYDVGTVVELAVTGDTVQMRVTFDAMHSDEWSQRQEMGWNSQIGKLDQMLAARA